MSNQDVLYLSISGLGYVIWPIYRLITKDKRSWTNAVLLFTFTTATIISGCSLVTMYASFHSKTPLNDAGDLIFVVFGLGFYAAIISLVAVLITLVQWLIRRPKGA